MSAKTSLPAPRAFISADRLYQAGYEAVLDDCIEGIERFPVDKRRNCSTFDAHNTAKLDPTTTTAQRTTACLDKQEPASSLISPPPSPPPRKTSSALSSSVFTAAMGPRAILHGRPRAGSGMPPHLRAGRGSPSRSPTAYGNQDTRSGQDARSNFAVQPAANAGNVKLKKAAVKVVAAAAPAPVAPIRAPVAPLPSPPTPGPVKAPEGPRPVEVVTKSAAPAIESQSAAVNSGVPKQSNVQELALDELYARLSVADTAPSTTAAAKSRAGPDRGAFSFGDSVEPAALSEPVVSAEKIVESHVTKASATQIKTEETALPVTPATQSLKSDVPKKATQVDSGSLSPEDFEFLYLRKAMEYLNAMPSSENVALQTMQAISTKLRSSYSPDVSLGADDVEKLKARFAFAVVFHIRNVLKQGSDLLTTDLIKKALQDAEGNVLILCSKLTEMSYIVLEKLDDVSGLCKTMLDVLPKPEPSVVAISKDTQPVAATFEDTKPVAATAKATGTVPKDPMHGTTAWPSREKREAPAAYRACILKGVAGFSSIHALQALVWGGRLESINLPESGSSFAVVRFLTPEACDTYFKVTENGIEVPGEKKTLVFVEKQPGPSSINDLMRNCIDSGASRCVRATDAEEDWSDVLLNKIARGNGLVKRELDYVKRGKTAQARYYIEFRFANIYDSLNFKRQLMDDPDWEHCTIAYAPDPCETARGVHFKDEDEDAVGFFA